MAVSYSWVFPPTGATPPTAAQMADSMIVDIVASADADVAASITHLLGVAPAEVIITPMLTQALTALSGWVVATISTTVVTLTKLASTGSGNAAVQLRVIIKRPHTIGR